MRVFKTKPFSRFSLHEGIDDALLCEAVNRAERGLLMPISAAGSLNNACPVKARGDRVVSEALFCSGKARGQFLFTALPRTNVRR